MAIRKRGSKYFVDVTLPNGERVRTMVGTKKQADAVERQLTADVVNGKLPAQPVDDIAFADFMPLYMEYARANKAKNTSEMEQQVLRGRIGPCFGHRLISQVDGRDVERYKVKRQKDGVGAQSINRELTLLSVVFRHAMRLGYARKNPVRDVERLRVSKRPPRFLSHEEIERLLSEAGHTYLLSTCPGRSPHGDAQVRALPSAMVGR